MSASPVGNTQLTRFDVVVIGSGAGGSAAAAILAKNGQKVLVLEAGPNHFERLDGEGAPGTRFSNDELKLSVRGFIDPHAKAEPRTFRKSATDTSRFVGDVNGLPKTVGGGGVHADLKMPRFMPDDFRLGRLLPAMAGASFADWPVDYDMLEAFYLYAERATGVQGVENASPFDPPRSAPYPLPPGVPMYLGLKAAAGAEKLGYHPFPYPTAVNSRPYQGRPACVDCGFCGGYGCPSHAKGSPAVTLLRSALMTRNVLLRPETRAIELTRRGSDVSGVVVIGPDGTRETVTADRYVLAASPIEDARLCFLSDRSGPGLGNSSGLVGRNLMFHFQTQAGGVFPERLHSHRGRTVTHGMSDFRGVPNDPMRPLGGIIEFGGSEGPIAEAAIYAKLLNARGPRLNALMRQSPLRDRLLTLIMQAEDAPQPTNTVDLDPEVKDLDGLPVARITYQSHDFEKSARAFYAPKMMELLGAAGARYAFVAPADEIPGSRHIMGTLRSGRDARTSVTDPTGRFHDVGNLFAADGALFPTSSGFNPTLTIVALALRVAGEMVAPGSPERALT